MNLLRALSNPHGSDIENQVKYASNLISKNLISELPKKPYIADDITNFEVVRNKTLKTKHYSKNAIIFSNTFKNSTFGNFRLIESFMSDSHWINVKVESGEVRNSAILNSKLRNVTFKKVDFSGTDLSGSTFENVTWINCICPDGKKGNCSKHTDFLQTRLRSYENKKPIWEIVTP